MNRILINQKTVNSRKALKKNQKDSIRGYCKSKSILKTKIGKLVRMAPTQRVEVKAKCLPPEANLNRVLELLEANKLKGMSGNGFSVKTKLESIIQQQSEKLFLINGAECEPGLIHDEWILKNYWEEVSKGIQLLCKIIPFERCVLAYKISRSEKKRKKDTVGFDEYVAPAKYPMGEEHMLVKQVFGKTLQKNENPVDAGVLVMNVQTVYQIYCLLTEQYRNGRYITVADIDSGEARVEYVKRGENIKGKLMMCFPRDTEVKYFAGSGIMAAHEVKGDEEFSDEISFAAIGNPADISNSTSCKGCGKCNRKCPSGVNIKEIVKRRETDNQAGISDFGIENCIHCGSCTFFCRAGKDISHYMEM